MKVCPACGMYEPDAASFCGACGKPVSQNIACAHCSGRISPLPGYAIYSEATQGIGADHRLFVATSAPLDIASGRQEAISQRRTAELGTMLYCENCANSLFAPKLWQEAKALKVEMEIEDLHSPEGREARSEVIDFSIALRAQRHGFNATQARAKARKVAKLWWKNQDKARKACEEASAHSRNIVTKRFVTVLLITVVGIALLLKAFARELNDLDPGTVFVTVIGSAIVGFGLWRVLATRPREEKIRQPKRVSVRRPMRPMTVHAELILVVFAVLLGGIICQMMQPPPRQQFRLLQTDQGQVGVTLGALASLAVAITLRSLFPVWRRKRILAFISFAVVVCGLVEGGLIGKRSIQRRLAPFEKYAMGPYSWDRVPASPSEAHVHGKVITVCSGRVCPLFMRLSDTLQPQAPNEVETIAYVDCGLKDVGTYVGKDGRERGIARQAYCRVTLADRLNNRIAGPEMFLGRAPPQSIETKPGESQNASGASPDDAAMVAYIEGLPRR